MSPHPITIKAERYGTHGKTIEEVEISVNTNIACYLHIEGEKRTLRFQIKPDQWHALADYLLEKRMEGNADPTG